MTPAAIKKVTELVDTDRFVTAYEVAFSSEWAQGLVVLVPEYMRGGVVRYVLRGNPPGDFLLNVFGNDLMGAAGRADELNLRMLGSYAKFLHNYTPRECWGNHDVVNLWVAEGGQLGRLSKESR